MPATAVKPPLVAVLKNEKLEVVQECEIPLERFPDCIILENRLSVAPDLPSPQATVRQFFRIGITDRRAIYREGVSYRISQ
jgi:hypothetical protein